MLQAREAAARLLGGVQEAAQHRRKVRDVGDAVAVDEPHASSASKRGTRTNVPRRACEHGHASAVMWNSGARAGMIRRRQPKPHGVMLPR